MVEVEVSGGAGSTRCPVNVLYITTAFRQSRLAIDMAGPPLAGIVAWLTGQHHVGGFRAPTASGGPALARLAGAALQPYFSPWWAQPTLLVAVDGGGREGGEADRDVFGATFGRGAVADPFAGGGVDGLAGGDSVGAGFGFDLELATEDDGVFVEFGGLAGLAPAGGADHAGDAEGIRAGVHAAEEFFDGFGRVAVGLDAGGGGDDLWHRCDSDRMRDGLRPAIMTASRRLLGVVEFYTVLELSVSISREWKFDSCPLDSE